MPGLANLQFRDPLSRMDSANLEGMAGLLGMWANNEQRNAQTQQAQAIENNSYQNIQDAIATRQAQALDNPADIDILRRGKLGQALSQDATGKYDQGVLPGRIATTNAENKTKLTSAQLEDMIHQLDIAASALDTPSPLGVNVIENEGLRNKVAKEMQRSGRSPKDIVQAMANSVKSAISNSPKFMADANIKAIEGANKMNEQALQNKGAMERAVMSEKRADERANRSEEAATVRANVALLQNLQSESKTLEEQISIKQMMDMKEKNPKIQEELGVMRLRIKQNKVLMDLVRKNMKSNPELLNVEPTETPKAKRTVKTKSGKEVTVEE